MSSTSITVVRSSVLLGLIALLGTTLLAAVSSLTHERIVEQEKLRVLQQLNEIIPVDSFNNQLLGDRIVIADETSFHHQGPVTVYRARMDGQPVAVLMMITAADGYNGDIRLLAGINTDGSILGVRVVSHRETPGLGDPIEIEKSDWILGFTEKSLRNPASEGWAVKRDGGKFDQFTGATISPRAIVKTIHNTLKYFEMNRQMLFDTPSQTAAEDD
jgi:electron transport complex protein RnfG